MNPTERCTVGTGAQPRQPGEISKMARKRERTMVMATRGVTLRDFLIFQLKLWLDGFKDVAVIGLSAGAMILDFIAGRGRRPRLFYSVVRLSERFDLWLNLNGAMERLESGDVEDGLFGASDAGDDTLLGQIEELVRGGDEPRGSKKAKELKDPE